MSRLKFAGLLLVVFLTATAFGQRLTILDSETLTGSGLEENGYNQFISKYTNYLYVCNGDRIAIFNASTPQNPQFDRNYSGSTYFQLLFDSVYSFAALNTTGMRVYEMETRYPRPTTVTTVDTSYDAYGLAQVGDYVYLARGYAGLATIDVTDQTEPAFTNNFVDTTFGWTNVSASQNLIAAAHDGGVMLFTRTNPAVPTYASSIWLSDNATQLKVLDSLLFVRVQYGFDAGLSIYNVADPANPVRIALIDRVPTAYAVDGEYVYLSQAGIGLSNTTYTYYLANLPEVEQIDSLTQNSGHFTNFTQVDDALYGVRYDSTNRYLTTIGITGVLHLASPNGGDILSIGDVATISWNSSRVTGDVTIELNRNYPEGEWETIASVPIANHSYLWNVTGPVSTTSRIRIRSQLDQSIGDVSNFDFTIQPNPIVAFTPDSLSFPNVVLHRTSTPQTIAIASQSESFLRIASFLHTDNRFSVQLLDEDSTVTGTDTLWFSVTFTPDTTLTVYDTLLVAFDSPYYPIAIPFSGNGAISYLRMSETTANFPPLEAGLTDTAYLYVRNIGESTITSLQATGTSSDYSVTLSSTTILPNDSATVQIVFHPVGSGTRSGAFTISAPGSDYGVFTISLSGVGITTPLAPVNLTIERNGNSVVLRWNPVTTSLYGYLATVDGYIVKQTTGNPYVPTSYSFLQMVIGDTSYTHSGIVSFSQTMNYQVTAWVNDPSAISQFPVIRISNTEVDQEVPLSSRGTKQRIERSTSKAD